MTKERDHFMALNIINYRRELKVYKENCNPQSITWYDVISILMQECSFFF